MTAPEEVWCRVEGPAGLVRRVNVVRPNGEILFSYPPDRFDPPLLRRMELGQVRGRLSETPDGPARLLSLTDEVGRVVFQDVRDGAKG